LKFPLRMARWENSLLAVIRKRSFLSIGRYRAA
jgi:hypothetical protein